MPLDFISLQNSNRRYSTDLLALESSSAHRCHRILSYPTQCKPAPAEMFQSSAADTRAAQTELDHLRVASDQQDARGRAARLCSQLKVLCTNVAPDNLPELASIVAGCCDLETPDAQSDVGVLEDATALFSRFPDLLQSKGALDQSDAEVVVGTVMRSVCNGVLTKLCSRQSLDRVQPEVFTRLQDSGFSAMKCITNCTSIVCNSLVRALPEGAVDGFAQAVEGVGEWITVLVGLAGHVVAALGEPDTPVDLRLGKTLTRTWVELQNAIDGSPAVCRQHLGTSAGAALSMAFKSLLVRFMLYACQTNFFKISTELRCVQFSLEEFVTDPNSKFGNDRYSRFLVQKCAHVTNCVPSSIGEMAGQIWSCTHGAFALSCLSPDVFGLQLRCHGSQEGVPHDGRAHQQMVVDVLKKFLLPKLISCALPALSMMPEALLHISLRDLCRHALLSCPELQPWNLLHGGSHRIAMSSS